MAKISLGPGLSFLEQARSIEPADHCSREQCQQSTTNDTEPWTVCPFDDGHDAKHVAGVGYMPRR